MILLGVLSAALVIALLLWRRESRKLADAETRERDASSRLAASEARLAAAEQAAAKAARKAYRGEA